jgi:hypothetical protein
MALRDNEIMTLVSPEAKFFFSKEVELSQAKLIRDTITAQMRGTIPSTRGIRITSEVDAHNFIMEHLAGPAQRVNFSMEFI